MKGKHSAWKVWKSYPEATGAFKAISLPQKCISDETFHVLEKLLSHFITNTQKAS